MKLPNPTRKRYEDLIAEMENGKIKIPQFQRNFVWDINKSSKLLDSILKGYPVGTFIIWKTNERLKMIGALGNIVFRQPDENEQIEYVLDGQQRITSLYVALKGIQIGKNDYSKIYVNLDAKQDEDIVITDISELPFDSYIQFSKLLDHSIVDLIKTYKDENKLKLIETYQKNVEGYDFSIIEVTDAPIETATDIFTRINTSVQPLSVFEIMCAKIFDMENKFDLLEKFNDFKSSLETVNFDAIPPSIPLQLAALILKRNCKGSTILSLRKDEFINIWDDVTKALRGAIDYCRSSFAVPNAKLLPYDVLLLPIAYYIYRKNFSQTIGKNEKYLKDMFWRYSLMQRYNNATESKLASDISVVDNILVGEEYKPAISIELNEKFFREDGFFRVGKSFTKALLCLYLLQNPKRLDNTNYVITDNKELLKGNGKNYHHFFPKAYMRKKGYDDDYIDNIINIIIVDDNTNKYKIKDKAPSTYINELSKLNDKMGLSLSSHLIGNIEEFGISDDNYEQFYVKRVEWVIQILSQYLCLDNHVIQDVDDDENEVADMTAHNAYIELWQQLKERLQNNSKSLQIDTISKSRIQTVNILASKVILRFVVSAKNSTMQCELVFPDEGIYQKLLMQKSDFESLSVKSLIWPDQDAKTKKIILRYNKSVEILDRNKFGKYTIWLAESGILLKDVAELFLEDISFAKGIAPDEVLNPVTVYCSMRIGMAMGQYFGKRLGFKVLRGSFVKLSTKSYGGSQKKRDELIKLGIIRSVTEAKGEFIDDYMFTTPSQAADVILGGSNNGWTTWKDDKKQTIDTLYRNKVKKTIP